MKKRRMETLKRVVGEDYINWLYFNDFDNENNLNKLKYNFIKSFTNDIDLETTEEYKNLLNLINEINETNTLEKLVETLHNNNSDRI